MKKWKAVHIWNPITLKVETGGSGVQNPPELHSESETYRLQKIQNAKQNEKQKIRGKRNRIKKITEYFGLKRDLKVMSGYQKDTTNNSK